MNIHVLPGDIPGSPLALTNELHALRLRRDVSALIASPEDKSETTVIARDWARRCSIPITATGRPDVLLIAVDLAATFGDYAGPISPNSPPLRDIGRAAWLSATGSISPRPNRLRRLLDLFRDRRTVLVNTTAEAYTQPQRQTQ